MVGVIGLSRASYRKMLQNLGWAAGYNIIAIPLAAGVLTWAGMTLSPAIGAVLLSASTIVVVRAHQWARAGRPGLAHPAGRLVGYWLPRQA